MNNAPECTRCHQQMEDLGEYSFRVGGATGVGGFLLGGWNQLSEDKVVFDLKICPTCRHVEFYLQH